MRAEQAAARAAEIRALVPPGESVAAQVAEIIADVRERGDAALEAYEARFGGRARVPFRISGGLLAPDVLRGLEVAIANVRAVAEAGLDEDRAGHAAPGAHGQAARGPGAARGGLRARRAATRIRRR